MSITQWNPHRTRGHPSTTNNVACASAWFYKSDKL